MHYKTFSKKQKNIKQSKPGGIHSHNPSDIPTEDTYNSQSRSSSSTEDIIPTKLYVVGGGPNSLFTISNALYELIPVVVFKVTHFVIK